jgi:hypothetical protein
MRAALVLIACACGWASLYQLILALASVPPADRELATASGVVRVVDTPVTRNRFVATTRLVIETAPVRQLEFAIRQTSLPTEMVRQLVGQDVKVTWAAGRPRNRWVYALEAGGRRLLDLPRELARDRAQRSSALAWMLVMGAASLVAGLAAWRRPCRSGPQRGMVRSSDGIACNSRPPDRQTS